MEKENQMKNVQILIQKEQILGKDYCTQSNLGLCGEVYLV